MFIFVHPFCGLRSPEFPAVALFELLAAAARARLITPDLSLGHSDSPGINGGSMCGFELVVQVGVGVTSDNLGHAASIALGSSTSGVQLGRCYTQIV
jgi:hypothetical protein